jgi:hypothetical protein
MRGGGTLPVLAGQVGLNLLTTWTGGVEALARVAADLRLPAATALVKTAVRGTNAEED